MHLKHSGRTQSIQRYLVLSNCFPANLLLHPTWPQQSPTWLNRAQLGSTGPNLAPNWSKMHQFSSNLAQFGPILPVPISPNMAPTCSPICHNLVPTWPSFCPNLAYQHAHLCILLCEPILAVSMLPNMFPICPLFCHILATSFECSCGPPWPILSPT